MVVLFRTPYLYLSTLTSCNPRMTANSVQPPSLVFPDDDDEDVKKNRTASSSPFCVPWGVENDRVDEWWTHHVDWGVSVENDTHYCFSPVANAEKAGLFRQLYDVQYRNTNCSKVHTKRMWSSGWGADFGMVLDGLEHALNTKTPLQMYIDLKNPKTGWHYASKKDGSKPVCPTRDMYCYFLNLTKCKPMPGRRNKKLLDGYILQDGHLQPRRERAYWLLEYATRMQAWLRREVYLYSTTKINMTLPCTAIHVRRSDVVLHETHARRYHKMEEYVERLPRLPNKNDTQNNNLFLLTDDTNAIGEALHKYPKYNWMYIDRPRFKGTSGGWENQIPSDDPKFETVVLLTIFRLVRQCNTLVRTYGNFADLLKSEMFYANVDPNAQLTHVDLDDENPDTHNFDNMYSVNVSVDYVHRCKAEKEQCSDRFDCCNDFGCYMGKCKKCKSLDRKCKSDDECCKTFSCYDGVCKVT